MDCLAGANPAAVLANLYEGDPLNLRQRAARRIERSAVLLHGVRLHLRMMAHTARAAMAYCGAPELDAWLEGIAERSLRELLLEDAANETHGVPVDAQDRPFFDEIAHTLGLPPTRARAACAVFNALPMPVRRAYLEVCVDGKSLNRYVAEGHGPPDRVRAYLRCALYALRG